ncbi:MAG TPA: hypothetical protein ENH23_01955, partial [candidate division Zixibacteria bacterium]|nr:hypothetical protein [candidate division Zixibacteria bacterium]
HYMCQQSLINYLHTGLTDCHSPINRDSPATLTPCHSRGPLSGNPVVSKEDIETLIHTGEQVSENEIAALIKEQNIKEGKQKTSGYKLQLSESIRSNAALIDDKLADITVCDPAVGSGAFTVGMMSEIVRARNVLSVFLNDNSRTAYEFKRRCIEHSLYGVDIDPGAVEIAKLRLWLSLVVDEDDIKNIKPLPNLDYKIVCGNSLLGVEKDLFNATLFSELERLKPLFFNETNPTKKQEYKKQIDKLISEITNGHTVFDFEVYFSEVFNQKGGFDVVIANPPYMGFHGVDKHFKHQLQKQYVSTEGKFDLYIPFIERSYTLMTENGYFVFICPTAFTKRDYGEKIRQFLRKNVRIKELIDFEHDQMFEGVTNYTGIFSFIKSRPVNCMFTYRTGFNNINVSIEQNKLTDAPWIFSSSSDAKLVEKIESLSIKLHEIAKISEGVVTGLNDLYLLNRNTIKTNGFEMKYFVSCYRGKEIDKYYVKNNEELLFYPYINLGNKTVPIDEASLKKECPQYYKHLRNNIDKINSRPYFVKSKKKWYELWNQRSLHNFSRIKIMTPELSERNRFALADKNTFYGDTVCGIVINKERLQDIDYKLLLAILNSELIEWYYKKTTVPKAGGFFIYKVMFLKKLPIKIPPLTSQQRIISFVDQILSLKQAAPTTDTSTFERKIDKMVYKLYDLTEEEIAIIEGEKK